MKKYALNQWLLFVLCIFSTLPSFACRFNVRDVGFVDFGNEAYQLHLISNDQTDASTLQSYSQISFAALLESNIELNEVNLDQADQPELQNQISQLKVTKFPAFVLESPRGQYKHLKVNGDSSDSIWQTMESLTSSPLREKILDNTLKNYGVALFIESDNAEKNKKALANTKAALEKTIDGMHNLPKVINEPPVLMTISPAQAVEEEILLWSLGIETIPPQEPHMVVKYGRGRTIGEVLKGDAITESRAEYILSVVGLSCECGLDRKWMLGEMFPLTWGADRQERAIEQLAFDPESPMIKTEISQIMATNKAPGSGLRGSVREPSLMGYTEMTVIESNSDVEPSINIDETGNEEERNNTTIAINETDSDVNQSQSANNVKPESQVDVDQINNVVKVNTATEDSSSTTILFSVTWAILAVLVGLVLLVGIAIALRGRNS